MPAEATGNSEGDNDQEIMPAIHRVIEYSGLTYYQVLELPIDVFQLMLKNHYLDELNSTQEGRDYLEKCKRLNTTEADRSAIANFMNRGAKNGK